MVSSLSVLGSTGSIGRQTLEVAREFGIKIVALTTNVNAKLAEEQARRFKPELVAAMDEKCAQTLKCALADTDIEVCCGMDGLVRAATLPSAERVLTAVVGMVGLVPTLAAIDAGKDIALANKETLVCAGELVTRRARERGVRIYPVDSEHSAIFQCLEACHERKELSRIILTASGGPFFGKSRNELQKVSVSDALKHPNWSMGNKITIDSATLMNKGLEFIEAMWLFGVQRDEISVIIHRESIIHSMIEFKDGAVLAQMGTPDMRLPIAYALTYPNRRNFGGERLDFKSCASLTFHEPDTDSFPCLSLAIKAAGEGGCACAILNGANEAVVSRFLNHEIGFLQIGDAVAEAISHVENTPCNSVSDVIAADHAAREFVLSH